MERQVDLTRALMKQREVIEVNGLVVGVGHLHLVLGSVSRNVR